MINDIIKVINKHIIQCYNVTQYNISEEPHCISSMTPSGFINGQEKSRYSFNYLFQVIFFSIFLGQLFMNINCDTIIENMDNSEY